MTTPSSPTEPTTTDPFDRYASPIVRWPDGPFVLVVERPESRHPDPDALPATDLRHDATARALPWVGDHHFVHTSCPRCDQPWRTFATVPASFHAGLDHVLVCPRGYSERATRRVPIRTEGDDQ